VSRRTLFFMPHCGKTLYGNVLEANWSREGLECLVVLGNSFASYSDRYVLCVKCFVCCVLCVVLYILRVYMYKVGVAAINGSHSRVRRQVWE